MKMFIFLLIVVLSFFGYLFFYNKNSSSLSMSDLENIEENSTVKEEQQINEYTKLEDDNLTAIPQNQTFNTIKNILKEVSGRKYSSNITLNTRITSYLYTLQQQEDFKQKISKAFGISYDKVDKLYKKNRLVWDWVNDFRE